MTSLLPKNEALADVDTIQKLTQIAVLGDGGLLNLKNGEGGQHQQLASKFGHSHQGT